MRAMLTLALRRLRAGGALALAAPARAQARTVADVRAELDRAERADRAAAQRAGAHRRGAAACPTEPATALTRLDQLEAELRRLTDRVDVLTNDVDRIVEDATQPGRRHRVPADRARGRRHQRQAAEPEPLGGGVTRPRPRPVGAGGGAAGGRRAGGRPSSRTSTRRWRRRTPATTPRRRSSSATFLATYPGRAALDRGAVPPRRGAGGAARTGAGRRGAILDAFSGAPQDPLAPRALYQLAVSLGELGQTDEACLTLTEVDSRYPGSEVAGDVAAQRQALACQ